MSSDRIPDVLPVFPLPDVVVFPATTLPLRVFEPRYVEMVEDLDRFDRWLAVTQLRPEDDADATTAPPFHPVAGAGRVDAVSRAGDGTYRIEVHGAAVVRLEEIACDRAYRRARADVLPEDPGWLEDPAAAAVLDDLVREAARFRVLEPREVPASLPASPLRRSALVNRIAMRVLAEPGERQALLEARDYRERTRLTARQVRVMANLILSLGRGPRPDDPGRN